MANSMGPESKRVVVYAEGDIHIFIDGLNGGVYGDLCHPKVELAQPVRLIEVKSEDGEDLYAQAICEEHENCLQDLSFHHSGFEENCNTTYSYRYNLPAEQREWWDTKATVVCGGAEFQETEGEMADVTGLEVGNVLRYTIMYASCPPSEDEVMVLVVETADGQTSHLKFKGQSVDEDSSCF